MAKAKSNRRNFLLCISILVCCFILILFLSGLQHETKKFKTLLLTFAIVLFISFLFFDIIHFMVRSLYNIYIIKSKAKKDNATTSPPPATQTPHESEDYTPNRSDFLKLRIESLKAQLWLTPKHGNETQNVYFKAACQDLCLFVRYFLLLLLVIVWTREPLASYNTSITMTILKEARFNSFGTDRIKKIDDIYDFMEFVLIEAFSAGKDYRGELFEEPGWVQLEIAKLLGVVRLRQVRYAAKVKGLRFPEFTDQQFMPKWELPYRQMHYVNKYWRIYEPWLPMSWDTYSWLLPVMHYGDLHMYPEHAGYIALLARNKQNGMQVLQFLRENEWLDQNTVAVFIDFTLYNVNSNIFSIVNIIIEQTPFGAVIKHLDVQCAELLFNFDELSYGHLLIILLYILTLIQFGKVIFLKAYHEENFLHSIWNIVDCAIILLNFLLVFMIHMRERYVTHLLQSFEAAQKLAFVDFRIPGQIHFLTLLVAALLIGLTTMRIWKTLQFANCFTLFTRTLSQAFVSLFSIFSIILIFLNAFCMSCFIINSNHTEYFSNILKSFTTAMCFSFGFGSEASPDDLNYGGVTLGFVIYLILMLSVSIFLINIFTTLLADNCGQVKAILRELRAKDAETRLDFFDYLKLEYRAMLDFFAHLKSKFKKSKQRQKTVSESIDETLNKMEEALAANEATGYAQDEVHAPPAAEDIIKLQREHNELELKHLERLRIVARILNTQLELLARELPKLDIDSESDEEETSKLNSKNDQMTAASFIRLLILNVWLLKTMFIYCFLS